jgi:CheY-like chemotaxis protein
MEIWLPVAATQAASESNEEAEDAEVVPTVFRTLDVLALDDDPLVLATLGAQLEDLGHRVTTASSGAEGLRHVGSDVPFDVVVTDYAMPGMTGAQFAELAHQQRPDLPVIIATGFAELTDRAGRDLIKLKKPFSQQDLATAIEEAVARLAASTAE